MRGYLPVSPIEIEEFSSSGSFRCPYAYVMTSNFQRENVEEDHEELEFQLSYLAAQKSRQGNGLGAGFVIALDLEEAQLGSEGAETIGLSAELRWDQVESVLVSDSDEEELTWYARQEVDTQLPGWLGMEKTDGAS